MVASEVSWKYLCKIKRVIWSQTQYERNVSWSQRRRYIGLKIIWVLTYWWEYCLCMNCFVTQHLKHITTNGAAARSSALSTSHRAGILKMVAPHNTEHSTQHSGYKTGGLHYSSCAHSAFHITISGHQQKVIIHEDSNSSGHRPCTCSRKCKVLDSFSMQHKCTIQCNVSGNGF